MLGFRCCWTENEHGIQDRDPTFTGRTLSNCYFQAKSYTQPSFFRLRAFTVAIPLYAPLWLVYITNIFHHVYRLSVSTSATGRPFISSALGSWSGGWTFKVRSKLGVGWHDPINILPVKMLKLSTCNKHQKTNIQILLHMILYTISCGSIMVSLIESYRIYLYKKNAILTKQWFWSHQPSTAIENERFPTRPRKPWDLAPSTLGTCARAGVGVASTLSAWARAARSVSYSSHWVSVCLLWFDEIWHEK